MSDELYLYLTTIGWKSGQPHEIEIWFVAHEGRYYLITEGRERAHWVQNIQRNPEIRFRIGEAHFNGHGRIVGDDEAELGAAVRAKMQAKYNWSAGWAIELAPAG